MEKLGKIKPYSRRRKKVRRSELEADYQGHAALDGGDSRARGVRPAARHRSAVLVDRAPLPVVGHPGQRLHSGEPLQVARKSATGCRVSDQERSDRSGVTDSAPLEQVRSYVGAWQTLPFGCTESS